MANGNGNSTHSILRWVIAIGVFLIVYFVAEDAMAPSCNKPNANSSNTTAALVARC